MKINKENYIILLTILLFRTTFLFTEAIFFNKEKSIEIEARPIVELKNSSAEENK